MTVPPTMVLGVRTVKILVSAVVEASVQVDTPEEFVTEHAPYVFALPLAVKVGVVPTKELLFASFNVMVMVEVLIPSFSTGPEPVMELCELSAGPVIPVAE